MVNEKKTALSKEDEAYNFFHREIYKQRVRAGITVDYYGAIATEAKRKTIVFNFLALASSSSSVFVFFTDKPMVAALLALVAAISSIVNIVSGWGSEESRFLDAQSRARFLENEWDTLWRTIDSDYKVNLDEIPPKMHELGKQYADIEQRIQPHNQKRRKASKIQERIERSLLERIEQNE